MKKKKKKEKIIHKKEFEKHIPKVKINETRLKQLIKIEDIEEFYYFISIIDEEQTNKFIAHYKKNKEKNANKISKIVHNAISKKELVTTLQQEIIAHLRERYENLTSKITEERKKGKDVSYEWIKSMSIPLKIKMYEATLTKKDFYKIKKLLDDLETDLKNIK